MYRWFDKKKEQTYNLGSIKYYYYINMKNKNILWAVSLLVLLLVLGLILFRKKGAEVSSKVQNNNVSEVVPKNNNAEQPQGAAPIAPSNLSADEKAALEASSGNSNIGAEAQLALAMKAAKETGVINVARCEMSPAVLKVKYMKNFTLKNAGTEEVTVVFYSDDVTRTVPAGGETVVSADFGKNGGGLFGYYCRSGAEVRQGLVLMYSL